MSKQRYLVTARKYRPALFKELVAQEHVSETLKNAIRLDRLAHAYLFSGPRGVGKTTAARILAKAINCTTPLEEREDEAEPCRECASCQSFEEGRNLNIIEFDAASNNKVDDIRELREKVRVPPQGGKKKVYIVDEVHMLSNAAFNALLKTLEEPPDHVLFIFATTEPNKVLPTILSRCQRFDFRRIPVADIVERLRKICEAEGVTADEASLMLIARKGDGALRDALSAFDQAVSLCGTELSYGELAQALGVVDVDLFFDVTDHVHQSDSAGMLRLVERIVRAGYDIQEFLDGLAEHFRNLLVAVTMEDPSLIAATDALRTRYTEHSTRYTEPNLLRLLMVVSDTQDAIKGSTQPRLKLEMALLKMTSLAQAADLRAVLSKIERLEEMAQSGELAVSPDENTAPPETTEPPSPDAAQEKPRNEAKEKSPATNTPASPLGDSDDGAADQPPEAEDTKDDAPAPREAETELSSEDASEADADDEFSPIPPSTTSEAPAAEEPASDAAQADASSYPDLFNPPALNKKKQTDPSDDPDNTPQACHNGDGSATASSAVAVVEPSTLQQVESAWSRYVNAIKKDRIQVGALLQHSKPAEVRGDTLQVAVPDDFHQRLLRSQHAFLIKHFKKTVTSDLTRLDFIIQASAEGSAEQETTDEVDPYEYMQQKREDNPVVRAIFEQFGGELVW